jgi:YfiH family protein
MLDIAPASAQSRVVHGLPVLAWPVFDSLPIDAFVTTRDGGVSTGSYASLNLGLHVGDVDQKVVVNRTTVSAAMDSELGDMVFCQQAHRRNVEVITEEERGRGATSVGDAIAQTDALVTTVPGIVLAVMVADCVPLVLFDPRSRVLGVVHAGWRGTIRGVTSATVECMQQLGAAPSRMVVGIGPAIHPDRYQVGRDLHDLARSAFGDRTDEVIRSDGQGTWLFDLWTANILQLTAAGVEPGSIALAAQDTGPGTAYFSHRSEGPCGRFAAIARIRPS